MKPIKHFKLITKHKWYVYKNCRLAGITWQGITHDLSKYSFIEFWESAKYFDGTVSPIDKSREVNGYSKAFLHHKGKNKHHWEYWIDGDKPIKMPFKYACELICDYIAAGETYMGKDFSFEAEYAWWQKKKDSLILMHKHTKQFVDDVLFQLAVIGQKHLVLEKYTLKKIYKNVGRNISCLANYTTNNQ